MSDPTELNTPGTTVIFEIIVNPADTAAPAFNSAASIDDQSYFVTSAIPSLTLPEATGDDGALVYDITPALPDGLTLSGRTLTGTPAVGTEQGPTTYTYRVSDSDGNTADTDTDTLTFTIEITVAPSTNICLRTTEVRDAILDAITPRPDCTAVPVTALAGITELDLSAQGITSLQSGDFAGLGSLANLFLQGNSFRANTGLPAGIFDDVLNTVTSVNIIGSTGLVIDNDAGRRLALRNAHFVCSLADADAIVAVTSDVTDCLRITVAELATAIPLVAALATLSGLTLSPGTLAPVFDSATTTYTVAVANSVEMVTVTPTATNVAGATITVNAAAVDSGSASDAITLMTVGTPLAIPIIVTAADGTTTMTYTVTATRVAPIISIAAGTSPVTEGAAATFTLTADPAPASNLTVMVTVDGTGDFISGAAPMAVTINAADTTATLMVPTTDDSTAEAPGTITATVAAGTGYTVHSTDNSASVTVRDNDSSTDATLRGLTLSAGTLDPVFAPGTTTYIVSVVNSVTDVTVTPTATDASGATITVDGNPVTSGSATIALPTPDMAVPIDIVVTAADTITTMTYTVTVTRLLLVDTEPPAFGSGDSINDQLYVSAIANPDLTLPEATGGDGALVYSISPALPAGLTLSGRILTGTPAERTEQAPTTYTYTVSDSDSDSTTSDTDMLTFVLELLNGRYTPMFRSGANIPDQVYVVGTDIGNVTLPEGYVDGSRPVLYSIRPTLSPPVLPPLTLPTAPTGPFVDTVLPNGLTLTGRVLTGTPTTMQISTAYTYRIDDSDRSVTDFNTLPFNIQIDAAALDDATLSGLTLSAGTLDPVFAPGTTTYIVSVVNSVTDVTVTPTATDASGATITVNTAAVTSGSATIPLPMPDTAVPITIVVTAADTTTTMTYTVTATRAAATTGINICSRTDEVQAAILAAITPTPVCASVTAAELASITTPGLSVVNAVELQSGDFAGLSGLESLSVTGISSGNQLSALPGDIFVGLSSLTSLSLTNHTLSTLPVGVFTGLTSLRTLALTDTPLSTLASDLFASLTSLRTLTLTGSAISTLPAGIFDGLGLTILQLSGNQFTTLDTSLFAGLSNLETLELHQNSLSTLPADFFTRLTSLTSLRLEENDLTTLDAGQFAGLTSLASLSLNNNMLTRLDAGQFAGLTSLTSLRLNNNRLTILDAGQFAGLRLRLLRLFGNPFTAGSGLPTGIFDDAISTLGGIGTTSGEFAVDDNGRAAHFVCSLPDFRAIVTAVGAIDSRVTDCLLVSSAQLNAHLRPDEDASLSGLTLSPGTLDPVFDSATMSYTVSVANSVTDVTVTPTATNAGATITVDGTTVASAASAAIPLTGTPLAIPIVVTAVDTTTRMTYTVTATRAATPTTPTISIAAGTSPVTEGTAATFTLTATPAPASNLTVIVTVTGAGDFIAGPVPAMVIINAAATTATLTVLTTDDSTAEAPGTITATVTAGPGYTAHSTDNSASVTVQDNDAASTDATLSGLTLSPGTLVPTFATGTTAYTVSVANSVTGVTVTPSATNAGATITVNGAPVASTAIPLPTPGTAVPIAIVVTAADGTTTMTYTVTATRAAAAATPIISIAATTSPVTEGTAAVFRLTADPAPASDLIVMVMVDDGAGDFIAGAAPTTVTINAAATTATLTVPTTDDSMDEANGTITATVTTDTGYTADSTNNSASVTVRDNDGRVTVSETVRTVAENGDTATYTVVLDSRPTATVTIAVASDDSDVARVTPTSLTFTTTNWNTAQTVTVTGVNDNVDNSNDRRTATVTHTAMSGDDGYNMVNIASVTVTVTDDDTLPTVRSIANQTWMIDLPIPPLTLPAVTRPAIGTPTYALSDDLLPAGLTYDASSRTISGTPTAVGSAQLTYTVTDVIGTTTVIFTIRISSPTVFRPV